jgi:hypothetical protein
MSASLQNRNDPGRPYFRRVFRSNANLKFLGRDEQSICVRETTLLDSIDPYDECFAERSSGLWRRTNEIGNRDPASLDHAIAEPTHATSVFNAILQRKSKIFIYMRSNSVSIKNHRLEPARKREGQGRLSRSR